MDLTVDNNEIMILNNLYDLIFNRNYIDADINNKKINEIEYLIDMYYNPNKSRKNIYENLINIKINKSMINNENNTLIKLKRKGLIEYFPEQQCALLTPLGLLFLKNNYNIYDNELKKLIKLYHKKLNHNLVSTMKNIGQTKDLPLSELAPMIFLLYNNNISEHQGQFKRNAILTDTIDKITSAFVYQDSFHPGTKDRNGSLSGYWLTEANRKLGFPIFNKKRMYYIIPEKIDFVISIIKDSIRKNPKKALKSYKAFKDAFDREAKILFKNNSLFATPNSKSRVNSIFEEVLKNDKT